MYTEFRKAFVKLSKDVLGFLKQCFPLAILKNALFRWLHFNLQMITSFDKTSLNNTKLWGDKVNDTKNHKRGISSLVPMHLKLILHEFDFCEKIAWLSSVETRCLRGLVKLEKELILENELEKLKNVYLLLSWG